MTAPPGAPTLHSCTFAASRARLEGGNRAARYRLRSFRFLTVASTGILLGLAAGPAFAQQVNVRVTIEQIEALDCVDEVHAPDGTEIRCRSDADLYAVVRIDDEEFTQCGGPGSACPAASTFDDNVVTPNWEFSKPIDLSRGSIPIRIQVWDDDDRPFDAWPTTTSTSRGMTTAATSSSPSISPPAD